MIFGDIKAIHKDNQIIQINLRRSITINDDSLGFRNDFRRFETICGDINAIYQDNPIIQNDVE